MAIRNNLAVLLAARNIKLSQATKDTGISRNTLFGIASNKNKMIQLETVNALCQYLEITPNEFFVYAPDPVSDGWWYKHDYRGM
ncbi:helix-turn-helix domain-containing protein [Lacticaseibacillus saniviri]|uniref:helix-turn-helix domain-containing protein n=1 Tax=Lacticaseibacillus saniviri TaxID=931533 RepID=UPI001EE138E5|nr:helix-turn-helix transcriptional regulator [Lacticaseibacillus saniviri]MCG4280890.1 helix-turn-helix transcriptional regulator [Lacticaseibacillus saniviri]